MPPPAQRIGGSVRSLAAGTNMAYAPEVAQEIESQGEAGRKALEVGGPAVPGAGETMAVVDKSRSYGKAARA